MISAKWDRRFLGLAKHISTWSRDPSTQVGAVLVDESKRIISLGYNGFAQLMPDLPVMYEDRNEKYSRIIHAEVNALCFAGKLPTGTTLYTYPFLSCDRCTVQMIQAGVVYFVAPKPSEEAVKRWGEAFQKSRQYISECDLYVREYDNVH